MVQYATFYSGAGYEQSSEPQTVVQVHEADLWPVADNSGSGTKDEVEDGLHPVVAVGGRTAADGRPLNVTGVVITCLEGLTEPVDLIQLDLADGKIVRNYVCNVLTYSGGTANTFEAAPVIGQPVYVDDSDDLGEGCTLSLSPLNDAAVKNPMAGVLWYCQDEYADASVGGPNTTSDWPMTWAATIYEYDVCVLLINGARDLS
jgi:hypothetical protein